MPKNPKETKKKIKKTKKATKRVKKTPLNILIAVFLFIFLILASSITYFAVILSISPKSIPIITKNIESYLSKAVNNDVSIQDSNFHISTNLNLKISIDNLEVIDQDTKSTITMLPEVDIEIPILPMFIGNFSPTKFIISNANLTIDYHNKIKKSTTKENTNQEEKTKQILKRITRFFVKLKNNAHKNSIFEIKNTNLTIINKDSSKSLYIKSSKITSDYHFGKLLVNFKNQITISHHRSKLNLNIKCIINHKQETSCYLITKDLNATSLSWIHKDLNILNDINAKFDVNSRLKYTESGLQSIKFSTTSRNGDFKYDGFFDKKIPYEQLQIDGSFDYYSKNLDLENISIKLKKTHKDYTQYNIQPSIQAKINISKDEQTYDLSLHNILIEELDKFWPSQLAKEGSRQWSIAHLKKGYVKKATANFTVNKTYLTHITADLLLEDGTINYSDKFPVITKVKAKAKFDIKSMKIKVTQGTVLKSKVKNATVSINDFDDENTRLHIHAKLNGHGSDLLRHAAFKSNFAKHIQQYFNGQSQNTIDLSIPINDETTTKSLYLSATSNITNNTSNYLEGDSKIEINSEPTSPNFNVKINAQKSKINCNILGIHKQKNEELSLTLKVDTKDLDNIKLNNIRISHPKSNNSISGNMAFNTGPFKITKLNINNSNFSQNNYDLSFDLNNEKLSLKGSQLNLAKAIANKTFGDNQNSGSILDFSKLQIVLKDLNLANNNNLNDAYIFYDCEGGLCKDGIVSLRKNDKQFLKLDIKETDKDYSEFKGKIFNVGELAESLGISDLVKDGKAKITAKNTIINNQFALTGTIEVYDDVTIFENESVKLLEKDDLYSTIKNKIFSNNKTTFKKVKIKFQLIGQKLTIQSLIAHNYKIGITAKGTIDLKNKIYDLQGFFIPGYLVNNLFGLGDIPVIGEIANLLTNGQHGGIFGIKYHYTKAKNEKDFHFKTNKISALVPTTIQGMF